MTSLDKDKDKYRNSVIAASEETFDHTCRPCEKKGKTAEAVSYCADCNELYCKVCSQFHESFSALKQHCVLGRDKHHLWGQQNKSSSIAEQLEKCSKHTGVALDMFCGHHNLICCHVCVSLDHRTCPDMEYIPQAAKGIKGSAEFKKIIKDLARVMVDVDMLKHQRHTAKATFQTSKEDILKCVKNYRQKVNNILDTIERQTIHYVEKCHACDVIEICSDIKACEKCLGNLKHEKMQLENATSGSESQVFIKIKRCQQVIQSGENLIANILTKPTDDELQFAIDSTLDSILGNMKCFGKLLQPIRLAKGTSYNVAMKNDNATCNIISCCQMSDGTAVLADHNNNKLKHLSSTYEIINHCDLSSNPRSVCCVGGSEVAVSDTKKNINFVFIGKRKMDITRSIRTRHDTYAMHHHGGHLYVTVLPQTIYVYTTTGECLRKYCEYNSVKLFSRPQGIVLSSDGKTMYVADYRKGLLTLDAETGRLISTFRDINLTGPRGLCLANENSVMVCGLGSHNIMQIDEKGKSKVCTPVSDKNGIQYPQAIIFDNRDSRLLVAMASCDYIKVFVSK